MSHNNQTLKTTVNIAIKYYIFMFAKLSIP